jgi:S1-C subfamily serine protease
MNERWFYAKDKKKHGPVPRDVVQAMLARGELAPTDMILQEGTTRWSPAGSLLPLSSALTADLPATHAVSVAPAVEPVAAPEPPRPAAAGFARRCGGAAVGALAQVPLAMHATAAQAGRLVGYWGSSRQATRLARHARRSQFALGLGLFRRGLGDPELLRQVKELEDRLRVLGEAGGSSRQALRDRDALLVRLAEPWLQSPTPPPNLEEEHERAVHAERARLHTETAHAHARSTLYPASRAGRARVLGGLALYLAILGVGVFLLIPSAPPSSPTDGPLAKGQTPGTKGEPSTKEAKKTLKQLNAELSPAVPLVESLPAGGGSGFLVRHKDRYLVVTNRHVVQPARSGLEVHFLRGKAGQEERLVVPADKSRLIRVHRVVDLALIDVSAMGNQLATWGVRPVTLASRDHVPEVGEHVFAIGHPGDAAGGVLTRTLSDGIISAVNRKDRVEKGTFLQVTVAINPGNSGGPIFDDEGKVVGVATFMIRRSGKDLALESLNFGLETRYVHELLEDPSQSLTEQEIAALFKKDKQPLQMAKALQPAVDAKIKTLRAKGYRPFTQDPTKSVIPFKLQGNRAIEMPLKGLLPKDEIYLFVVSQGSEDVDLHVYDRAGKLVVEDIRVNPDPEVSFSTATGGDYRVVINNLTANPAEGVLVLMLRGVP